MTAREKASEGHKSRNLMVAEIKKAVAGDPTAKVTLAKMTPKEAATEKRIRDMGNKWAFGNFKTREELADKLEEIDRELSEPQRKATARRISRALVTVIENDCGHWNIMFGKVLCYGFHFEKKDAVAHAKELRAAVAKIIEKELER